MKSIVVLTALLIGLGASFRLYGVDHRVFWDDEAIAAMHIVGVTEGELVAHASAFREMGDLYAIVHPRGKLRPASATIVSLATEDPQHPPFYYLVARAWAGFVGDSRLMLRLLSAVIGVAAIPCMFWLCWELFGSAMAGWIGASLIAVSPVAVLYSQQIREYSLWLVAILVSNALFVRAFNKTVVVGWLVYAIVLGASFYVFPGTAFVALAHAAVSVTVRRARRERTLALAAIVVGCFLFAPWMTVILSHIDQVNQGMATVNHAQVSRLMTMRTLAKTLRVDTLDLDGTRRLFVNVLTVPILGFLAFAVLELRRREHELPRALAWALLLGTICPIVVPDLLLGGTRTANIRYFMPAFVALDLAVVALAVGLLTAQYERARTTIIAMLAMFAVCRVGSCFLAASAAMWWSDYNSRTIAVSAAINSAAHPLVVGDNYIVWALELSEYTDKHVRVALSPRCYLCRLPESFQVDVPRLFDGAQIGSVFLLGPSQALQREAKQRLGLEKTWGSTYECINIRDNCAGRLHLW